MKTKILFDTNDDWNDASEGISFASQISKKQKSKVKNLEKNEVGANSVPKLDKNNDRQKSEKKNTKKRRKTNDESGNGQIQLEQPNKTAKNKTKKSKNQLNGEYTEEFDGVCKFTPLLRKPQQNGDHNAEESSSEVEETNGLQEKKKKSRKRKKNKAETEVIVKKNKLENDDDALTGKQKTEDESAQKNFGSTEFANKLRENLLGGRFRFLNEQLYTVPGSKAKEIFEQDKEAFKAYHQGYRQQVEKWPFNPLERIIKRIRRLPKHVVVADFGCGEAVLAESIKHKCFSIDLVSSKPGVIACDMANTPLKSQSVDVAVFCLSLMGTNLKDFICEANRVLKKDGTAYVAEIGSRFENVKDFKKVWEHLGFQLLRQDVDKKNYFYFFDFQKVDNIKKSVLSVDNCVLKPCIYKKR